MFDTKSVSYTNVALIIGTLYNEYLTFRSDGRNAA